MSKELPRSAKVATVWLLLGLGLFLAVQWWPHRQQQGRFQADGDVIALQRGADGHYHWPGTVNGRAVEFLVDTGATGTAIPARLARELGLRSQGAVRSSTAGGVVDAQLVRVDLHLQGGVLAEGLRVVALPGLGDSPLLGMDVLGRLRWTQGDGLLRIDLRRRP